MQSYRGLALETSGRTGSVAVFEGTTLVATHTLDPAQRSAQSLAPALARLLAQVDWQPTDIKLVAVARGPGSFTGLRVGVTTAKVFAYAVHADVIGVDTLEAIAAAVPQHVSKLQVVMDAQRGDLYTATFARSNSLAPLASLMTTRILSMESWLASLDSDTWVAGPLLERLANRLPAGVPIVDPCHWSPHASGVAQVGWRRYQAGQRDDLWKLAPNYLRRSAAEEKLLAASPAQASS